MDEENVNNRKDGWGETASATSREAKAGREAKAAREESAAPPPATKAEHRWKRRARLKVLLIAFLLAASVGVLVWYLSVRYWTTPVTPIRTQPTLEPHATPADTNTSGAANENSAATPPATETPSASPTPAPTAEPAPQEGGAQQNLPAPGPPPAVSGSLHLPLLVPVQGVRAEDLRDTYTQSRSEGRSHNAIDIMAPRGTPVLAATDGKIVRLFTSVPGGITAYQLATDDRTILYYAHLERYADGLAEGHIARRGEVIGYVGDTGNAGAGNYHLHFSVSVTSDPRRWYDGENVNPYPLFRD